MATNLYSQTIKNIVSGISQQPAILRLPEQLEEQINGYSTEVGGLQKRAPTVHIKNLFASPSSTYRPLVHVVKRDEEEKYIMIFDGNGSCKIYDEDGKEYKVTIDAKSASYISGVDPRKYLKCITIADYTFIVNTKKKVAMTGKVWDSGRWKDTQGALFNVKSGQYGRTYACIINDVTIATYTTPDGSNASDSTKVDVNWIAEQLATSAKSNGWTVETGDSWLYVKKAGTTIKTVKIKDGYNGMSMFGIYHAVQNFNNLPRSAPNGFTVQVKGATNVADDYYVRYDGDTQLWTECARPETPTTLDSSTMPQGLVRNADMSFTLKPLDWDDRDVGDEDSNPEPSFVGATINDIFFYRNRLGLISGENVILSRSASFFNFWFASVVDMQDTDPIDLAVSHNSVSILYHAVPFDEELLLFSNDTQFLLRADGVLSPKNCSITEVTEFTCNPYVRPVGAGRRVYFPTERAEFTTIKEYFTIEDTTNLKDAQDVTSHVPSFIPNGVYKIVSSNTENVLGFFTIGAESKVYIYKYLFVDNSRLQSSWSYWEFNGARILGGGFINSTLYLVFDRQGMITLESVSFTYNTKDYEEYEPYRVFMDRKVVLPAITSDAYDDIEGRTKVDMKTMYGDTLKAGVSYGLVDSKGFFRKWTPEEMVDGRYVWLQGNWVGRRLIEGELYKFKAKFSEVMIRKQDDNGVTAYTEGRLQLRNFWVNYENCGYIKAIVECFDKETYEYVMTARLLGSGRNKIGLTALETGQFKFPVQSLSSNCSISIETELPMPVALIGAGWEGVYYKRATRV
nr:MAG TPA: stabilization protein [Caudoviricetes sp.]